MKTLKIILISLLSLLFVSTAAYAATFSDAAVSSGIFLNTNVADGNTEVFDFNEDGVSDLIMSRHQLYGTQIFRGNADGTFILHQTLPLADRHGCDSADFNGDGLVDFFCAVGALKGTATNKENDVWFQAPDGSFVRDDNAWGAYDPSGRGRDVAAFDANGDGRTDIFVGNAYPVSGGPTSVNRLYLNNGSRFVEVVAPVLNKSGGICVAPADYDADGDMDIFVCGSPNHLYKNTNGSYTDVGKSLGLSPQNARDADWADVDSDGDQDLVQVSTANLRVFRNNGNGTFTVNYTLALQNGRNSALADADSDGDLDIYVVNGLYNNANANDKILFNNGSGSFTASSSLPQATSGGGANVAVIEDYLGSPAFVVTNGEGGGAQFKGPRQLIVPD